MISDNETIFSHKLLLTNGQVVNLPKAFANHSSTDINLSKTQLSRMIRLGGFVGRLLGLLLKTGLPLKYTIEPLATTTNNNNTTLIISNNEIEDFIKIVKPLEDSGLLLKGATETAQNEVKKQKGGIGASVLGNILTGRQINRAGKGRGKKRAGEGVLRAGYGNKIGF